MIGAGFTRATRFSMAIDDPRYHGLDSQVVNYTPPAVSQAPVAQETPYRDVPWPGTKLSFDDLNVTALMTSGMANVIAIYEWIRRNRYEDEVHDIVIHGYSDTGEIVYKVRFTDAFPNSLSYDQFTSQDANDSILKFNVVFSFTDMVYDN